MLFKSVLTVSVLLASASAFAAATAPTAPVATAATTAAKTTATAPKTTTAATPTATALPKADANAVDYTAVTLAEAKTGVAKTVKGPVADTYCDANMCALNFHTEFRKHLSVIIMKKDFVNFAKIPGADMKAKMDWYKSQGAMQVTGKLQEYVSKSGDARPQILAITSTDIKPITLK